MHEPEILTVMSWKKYLSVSMLLAVTVCQPPRSFGDPNNQFDVLQGRGIDVCNAYKNRLEGTKFTYPPYCDRFEDDLIPGFQKLARVYLDAEKVLKIYDRVVSFQTTSNQYYSEQVRKKSYLYPDKERSLESIRRKMRTDQLSVWYYDPPLDVDNDGKPDNVVIWKRGRCRAGAESTRGTGTRAYIFNEQLSQIDEAKTTQVFGHPKPWNDPSYTAFRQLGPFIGLFTHQGNTYFDVWPLGYSYGSDQRDDVDVKIYKRENKKTNLVCTLHWKNR